MWQDWVLMVVGFGFSIFLIPTIKSKEKPPLTTSVPTSILLAVTCFVYWTLGLWLAFFSGFLTFGAWLAIAIIRIRS